MVLGTNAIGETSTYLYNALGYLVKHDDTEIVIDWTSAYQNVLAKFDGGSLTQKNVYGLDRISTQNGSLKTYIRNDRLGSGRFATDASGDLVGFADLDEWGNHISIDDPNGVLGNFTNHEFDSALGVYYAKARFYDPEQRRFLAVDPVKGHAVNPQTINPYAYVLNDPIGNVDPDGRFVDGTSALALEAAVVQTVELVVITSVYVPAPLLLRALALTFAIMLISMAIMQAIRPFFESAQVAEQRYYREFEPCEEISELSIERELQKIAQSFPLLQCVQAADAMKKYLKKNGFGGEIIEIMFHGGNGYVISLSRSLNKAISENGRHVGLLYNGMVYCNVHPYGLPEQQWIDDFEGVPPRTITRIPF